MKTVKKIDAVPTMPHRKKVAGYARVSDSKDTMRHSLFAQVSYYSALIQRHIEWEFVGVYADEPTTGTKGNRKEFQRMLEDCRAGKVDMIITKSITRFARNTLTTLETVRELKLLDINVYFEKERIHSISGDGELMLSILASFAQEESRSVSENCKWRVRNMFREGRPNTNNTLGYRLIDGKYYIVPEEAEIVHRIFTDYLSGLGKEAIANKLSTEGIPTKYGGLWTGNAIAKIIRNEKYAGNMLLQKTYIEDHLSKKKCINKGELPQYYVQNSHEPIISLETFNKVQKEIARREKKYFPPNAESPKGLAVYPFTGLIRCGQCGGYYRRKHTNAGSKYEKIVWICRTFNSQGKKACASQQIPENILMDKAAEAMDLPTFDETAFANQIAEIRVPVHNKLTFVFCDGHIVDTEWHNPSRRESWTVEMKQVARDRQHAINQQKYETKETTS